MIDWTAFMRDDCRITGLTSISPGDETKGHEQGAKDCAVKQGQGESDGDGDSSAANRISHVA